MFCSQGGIDCVAATAELSLRIFGESCMIGTVRRMTHITVTIRYWFVRLAGKEFVLKLFMTAIAKIRSRTAEFGRDYHCHAAFGNWSGAAGNQLLLHRAVRVVTASAVTLCSRSV